MKNQLIPPPELALPSVKHLSVEQKVQMWAQLMDESESMPNVPTSFSPAIKAPRPCELARLLHAF